MAGIVYKMDAEDFLHLNNELTISVKYISYGLQEIEHLTGMPDSNHLIFYLLSNGFERLMKCIICFWDFKISNKFPRVKKYKHNLYQLKQEIIKICDDMNYRKKCQACREDVEFLENDILLKQLIDLLSEFGKEARYYNFDKLTNEKINYDDPDDTIENIEKETIAKNPELQAIQMDIKKDKEFTKGLNNELLKIMKRLARALCRLFTLGDLGQDAKSAYSHVSQFINLHDSDL